LNLLQSATGGAAESRAGSTEIVRCKFVHANLGGELLNDMPDEFFRYSFAARIQRRYLHAGRVSPHQFRLPLSSRPT